MFAGSSFNSSPYTSILNGIPGDPNNPDQQPAVDFFSSKASSGSVGADMGTLGPEFKSYCVDLFQAVDKNVVNLADVSETAATVPDGAGLPRNIGAAGWIVNNFGVQLGLINMSPAWASLEAAAGVNPANVTYLEQVAVLQTAVWAKSYGAASSSISGSEGGSTNADANALLTQLLALSDNNTAAVGFINYPLPAITGGFNDQDQLFQFIGSRIPEPSSWVLLGLGALGVLGASCKRYMRARPES
jgi:hypothetical protein